ncbi:hypothetical protein KP509_18G015500 [Ceratopteris richardii]|uniref:Uncharacterized protein n=1 Tax=Ceratopteris richardii TaxID=49495 RepID=A0A8T2SPX3_CERRI|nr:hypothetical protein KP509_18G015500 [Ceratopteris richardii]
MAISLRLVCAVVVVALVSSCVQCAEVDVGRKLSAGSGEGRELMYKEDGYEHMGMDSRMKDGYEGGSMGGSMKGYGRAAMTRAMGRVAATTRAMGRAATKRAMERTETKRACWE